MTHGNPEAIRAVRLFDKSADRRNQMRRLVQCRHTTVHAEKQLVRTSGRQRVGHTSDLRRLHVSFFAGTPLATVKEQGPDLLATMRMCL
jgi:hypothetical protein